VLFLSFRWRISFRISDWLLHIWKLDDWSFSFFLLPSFHSLHLRFILFDIFNRVPLTSFLSHVASCHMRFLSHALCIGDFTLQNEVQIAFTGFNWPLPVCTTFCIWASCSLLGVLCYTMTRVSILFFCLKWLFLKFVEAKLPATHTRIFARAYYLRPNNASHLAVGRTMFHAGTKSARPSIASSPEPWRGLTLIEPLRPYYLRLGRRSRSDGKKLSIPSTSRILAARRGEPSTNLLAGLDAPFASALTRQTPSPRNSWRTGHIGPRTKSPPGWSARSCPTDGRFQHLRLTVSPKPLGRRSWLLPSDAWSQESLRDWIPFFRRSCSTPGRVSNLGFATSSVPACANSKFQRSGE